MLQVRTSILQKQAVITEMISLPLTKPLVDIVLFVLYQAISSQIYLSQLVKQKDYCYFFEKNKNCVNAFFCVVWIKSNSIY